MAITSLVLGLVAFPGICFYGVPAVALGITAFILGRKSLRTIRASGGALSGEGLAQAGWICGVIAGSLGALYMLIAIGIFALAIIAGSMGAFESPTP